MRSLLQLALMAGLPVLAFGQSGTDSLRLRLIQANKDRNPTMISRCLADFSWHFVNAKQYDSAIHYGYRALIESKQISDTQLRASVYTHMGVAFSAVGLPDSSIYYYDRSLALYSQAKDTINVVTIQANLAIIFKNTGLLDKSLETSFAALSMLERRPPDRALASCYNTIGAVYEEINDYKTAQLYNYKALAVRRQIGYERGIGQSYNNIGQAYVGLLQYDSALANFLRSLEIKRRTADKAGAAVTLNNIGTTLLELKQPVQAEPYLRESLSLKRESFDRRGVAVTLNTLAEARLMTGNLSDAEKLLREAEPVIQVAGALDELRRNLVLKVALYKARKDYNRALQHAEQLMIIKDSLLNRDKIESMQIMQVRYETEKKEQQIALLEQSNLVRQAEIETKQFWIYSLIVVVLLIAAIGTLFYNNLRIVREHRHRVETLLHELNHRVKNNLQILSSIFTLQAHQATDETTLQAMKSGEGRVNAMALIHKKLYTGNETLDIRTKEYFTELIQYLVHSYGFDQRPLQLKLHFEEVRLDVDKVIRVGLIVNELVSNALKYAYAEQEQPVLEVSVTQNGQYLRMEISDNGVGVAKGFDLDTARSFGLKMIRTLAKELHGKLEVANDGGARFILSIPL